MPDPSRDNYAGLLFIGDPHVAHRPPGFRKDDFTATVLGKLRFALEYAREHELMPVLLGDLFDVAHNNANVVVVELMRMLRGGVFGVVGNHDRRWDEPGDCDSLSILVESARILQLDEVGPWVGTINGCTVVLGGTPNHKCLPDAFDRSRLPTDRPAFVFWVAHHDLNFPSYICNEPQRCREIPGIDVVVNGHIHKPCDDVRTGSTLWVNPGNITRLIRDDATRARRPGVLRVDFSAGGWTRRAIEVPHQPFDEVFHPVVPGEAVPLDESIFIRELGALQSIRTAGGAGLETFLDANLPQFDPRVGEEIRALAREVLSDGR